MTEAKCVLSFKYRLLPTKRQHRALAATLEDQRQLYNAALEERIGCYAKTKTDRTLFDQCKALTEWRQSDPIAAATPNRVQRWTLKRLDDAYQGFFRQMKQEGQRRAGHPRFRGERWRTFGFSEFSGIRLVGRRLYWNTMPGGLRVRFHRALPEGKPLACSFTRTDKGWTACFQMSVETAEPRATTRPVGLDIGLTTLAALSTGERIPNLRHAKRVEREERRRQRALSRCKRGSARRAKIRQRLARLRRKVADTRATYLHQISAGLVRRFDLIAVEKLDIGGMARSALSKHIHDASWGQLRQKLAYKAARAGAQVIEVDPRNTSQTCPECGQVAVKDLKQRVHNCACGCVLDRDVAAARVILHRAVAGPGALNVTGYGVRALGNTDRQIDTLPHVG